MSDFDAADDDYESFDLRGDGRAADDDEMDDDDLDDDLEDATDEDIDLVIGIHREDGVAVATPMAKDLANDLDELIAQLRRAAAVAGEWRLAGHTLVVTLEPCTMCAGASVLARVDRIVFGAFEPKAGAIASLFDVVRDPRLNHRPEVVGGFMADECAAVLRQFFGPHRAD